MKILVVLGHPDKLSFNHAIAQTTVKTLKALGHEVVFHDLHAENFDPTLRSEEIPSDAKIEATLQAYCEELACADGVVIIHPNWWGQPPAILKGWIDRVIRPDVAYRFEEEDSGEGIPVGLLKAKKAVVFNTANTPQTREQNHFGDPLETLWKTCIFDLCGVKSFRRRTFSVIITSTKEQREAWLQEASDIIKDEFAK